MTEPARIPDRAEAIRHHREAGGLVAAVFPIHYPRALFRAFNVLPVEIWAPRLTGAGDDHLQAYTCSIVRTGLSFLLSERAERVDLVLAPHACDSTQGLGSLLLDLLPPPKPVLTLYLPRGEGQAAASFLAEELQRLFERLAQITGRKPTTEQLRAHIASEEAADALSAELLRARPRSAIRDGELYRLLRAREYLPADTFAEHARAALERPEAPGDGRAPVLLSGIVPDPPEILDALDVLGARVVADDLAATGRRLYPPGRSAEPFLRMAERLLSGPPDSSLGASMQVRANHLKRLAQETGAKAAIFLQVKFCEPEQFYLPALRRALEEVGVRSVVVELNPTEPLPDQATTRIEALLETLA